jgi:hypothetical protein
MWVKEGGGCSNLRVEDLGLKVGWGGGGQEEWRGMMCCRPGGGASSKVVRRG